MPRMLASRGGPLVAVLVWTFAGCGGGGGSGSPTAPPMPTPSSGSGGFEVVGAGLDQSVSYGASNLVFCRSGAGAGWADLWVRLAEQPAANGENGPHLDIDLCALGDGGDFAPQDPGLASCAGAKTFDVFWHARDGRVFANAPNAPACTLTVARTGSELEGTFRCRGMVEVNGTATVDVLGGSFRCTPS